MKLKCQVQVSVLKILIHNAVKKLSHHVFSKSSNREGKQRAFLTVSLKLLMETTSKRGKKTKIPTTLKYYYII